ncbi:MAG: HAMP domain-containing histidine kinase [Pseudobdellovibrionaceae bacterium]|nr:HAMP domain-containing histidine kinase [Pseudobdellovibrionaceae bacterium]
MNIVASRLASFCMRHLEAGQNSLKDKSCRLQLMVLNASVYITLGVTSLYALILLLTGQLALLIMLLIPVIIMLLFILYLARCRCFLTARVAYLVTCLLSLLYGIHLQGKETNLSLLCLHLALFPFLLFRAHEWRWIAFCSTAAFAVFEIVDFNLIPMGTQPLAEGTARILRLVITLGSFIFITTPSALLLWQSNQHYRKALKRNRVLALDEKMAAIGRLAGGAAHEINNPLAIIQLTLESLENHAGPNDPRGIKPRIQKAYDAIHRIHSILQKLLVSTPLAPAQPEPLCVHAIAQLITQRSKRYLYNHGIQLKIKVDITDQSVIHCERQHVIDAVDSLINNALEAMLGHKTPTVSLTLRSHDRFFQVEVADCGPGVSDEINRSLFTPFFTTKEVGAGLGLSLYSARCIARQYGGDLTCDSGPGGRFCLSLPLQKLS